MDIKNNQAVLDLSKVYSLHLAKYLAIYVAEYLSGTYPCDQDKVTDFIDGKLKDYTPTNPFCNLSATNCLTRFVYECAEYAIENAVDSKESFDTFVMIADLPSMHHEEIEQIVVRLCDLYLKTLNFITKIVMSDVDSTVDLIQKKAANRVSSTTTGGVIYQFNWGVLSDGLELNKIMMKGYDVAHIFKPNTKPERYHAPIAIDFAYQYANKPVSATDDSGYAYIDMLLSHIDDVTIESYGGAKDDIDKLILEPYYCVDFIDACKSALADPTRLVGIVKDASTYYRVVTDMLNIARTMDEETVAKYLVDRLDVIASALMLCLAAFEVLRETAYENALIVNVADHQNSDDPLVDVYVNTDHYSDYINSGGSDSDLSYIGIYLSPSTGNVVPIGGYSLDWVQSAGPSIVGEMMADEQDRLAKLRSNDAVFIKNMTHDHVRRLVVSYHDAAVGTDDLPKPLSNTLADFCFNVAYGDKPTDISVFLAKTLLDIVNDDHARDTGNILTSYMTDENIDKKDCVVFTIVTKVIADLHELMNTDQE